MGIDAHGELLGRLTVSLKGPAYYFGVVDGEQTDLDGTVISSSYHLHAEHAVACLERGLPGV